MRSFSEGRRQELTRFTKTAPLKKSKVSLRRILLEEKIEKLNLNELELTSNNRSESSYVGIKE